MQALRSVGPPCNRSHCDQEGSSHQPHAPLVEESSAEAPL